MSRTVPLVAAAALAALSACAGNPVRTYTGPAPENALTCALRQGAQMGYNPIRGGASDGYVVLERARENDLGRVASMIPGVRRPTDGDEITVTQLPSSLRVAVNSYYQRQGLDRRKEKPSGESMQHAQSILSTCGSAAGAAAPTTQQ